MTLPVALHDPLLWGLGFLAAGGLCLVVFVLPSLVFPADRSPLSPSVPPPSPDHTPFLARRMESGVRPLAKRLEALETRMEAARDAAVPSAGDLRLLYDGLDGLKRGVDDVRSLAGPLSAGARDRAELGRRVDVLVASAGVLLQDTAQPLDALGAARAERTSFEEALRGLSADDSAGVPPAAPELPSQEDLARDAARLAADREALSQLERRTAHERDVLHRSRRRARYDARLARRLAGWRRAWRDHLAAEEASLRQARAAAEERRRVVDVRWAAEKSRLEAAQASVAVGRAALDEDRRRFEEQVLHPWREEKARGEAEVRSLEERIAALRTETSNLEGERSFQAAASPLEMDEERRRAREDQVRWRGVLRKSREEIAAHLSREQAALDAVREAAAREESALREALAQAQESLEKERASLSAAEAETRERAGREGEQARRALEDRRREAQGLQQDRDRLAALLDEEKDRQRRAVNDLKNWAVLRYRRVRDVLDGARLAAEKAIAELRAESSAVAQKLEAEKESARRDVSALERSAAADREKFNEALRRAREEHRLTLAGLAREEQAELARGEALAREAASLKAEAERLRVQSRDRLFRRRAAHEKRYVQLRQKVESAAVEDALRLADERALIRSAEARLSARRRRMDTLRKRRREAMTSLLERAAAAFEAAAEARRRAEGLARSRLAALKDRSVQTDLLKRRWAEAPRWIEESLAAGEARADLAAEAERTALLAETENRQEEALRLFEENRRALDAAADGLKSLELRLDDEETAERVVMGAAANMILHLERFRVLFQAARPAEDSAARSEVA